MNDVELQSTKVKELFFYQMLLDQQRKLVEFLKKIKMEEKFLKMF